MYKAEQLLKENFSAFLESGALIAQDYNTIRLGIEKKAASPSPIPGKSFFYFPDYFLKDKNPWFSYALELEIEKERFLELLSEECGQNPSCFSEWTVQGYSTFHTACDELHHLFNEGHLQKAVPFVFADVKGSFTKKHLINSLVHALNNTAKNPLYLYGFWDSKEGMLGMTPELLFSLKGKMLKTMACAGTAPKGFESSLLQDPKIMHEHLLVVEGIENSLTQFGKVEKGDTAALSLPTLCHLVTPIQLELVSLIDTCELIKALHPTPALGAFPKEEGLQWLLEYEKKLPRKRFGAPVGYLSNKNEMIAYVAIRNVQWGSKFLKIGAGCGVVKGSEFDKEWSEIELKIKSVRCMLGL